jgi:serine/threonine protein kinase
MIKITKAEKLKLEKLGYILKQALGSGAYGTAYLLKNGNVLKVTSDDLEARTSGAIVNRNNKHIAKIYRVFRFSSNKERFFIEQEKLKADRSLRKKIDRLLWYQIKITPENEKYARKINPFLLPNLDVSKTIIYFSISELLRVEFSLKKPSNNVLLFVKNSKISETQKKFITDIVGAAKELKRNKITWNDLHPGNVAIDDKGNYKIIDLGLSEIDAKSNIEEI